MIKNVIFDFGRVLVDFNPRYIVAPYVDSEEDEVLLAEVLFDRIYWDRLDMGDITDEEVIRLASERLPERLKSVVSEAYYNWIYRLPPIKGMWELVSEIKQKYGVKVYLISDISKYFASHRSHFSVLDEMEECVFSATVGLTKPNPEIFEYLLEKANIRAEESVFIDDSPRNIDGAASVGIVGYLFDGDSARLKTYLENLLLAD